MDERTEEHTNDQRVAASRDGRDDRERRDRADTARRDAEQGSSPDPEQQALPFDDEDDAPIDFALTAAAHRVVASDGPPPLQVAPEPAEDEGDDQPDEVELVYDDPSDTRPSRARALRRAGLSVTAIADQLQVSEEVAQAWIDEVVPAAPPRQRRQLTSGAPPRPQPVRQRTTDEDEVGWQLVRAEAARDAVTRLADDPSFALGLGLLAGLRDAAGTGLTLTTGDPVLATRLMGWLREHADADETDVRIVLRLGRDVAGDLARHRWAQQLGVDPARVAATRSRGSLAPDAVEALLRVTDPALAATLAGWCDALSEPAETPLDLAF